MPLPDSHYEPGRLTAPIEALLDPLAEVCVEVALGLVLGTLAARLLRARGQHWSWAVVALALPVLAGQALSRATSVITATAAVVAAVRGRRWHREDIDAGADLAHAASGRRAPREVPAWIARAAVLRRRSRRASGSWFRGCELIVGRDQSARSVSIPFGGSSGTHTLLVGATGSGKTVTQTWIAVRAIERGIATIVIDPKGDRAMREALRDTAATAGSAFIEWSPDGPGVYNPFASGSDTAIADKALAGERFTEPHYLRQAQRYLGHEVRALRGAGLDVSLRQLVEHLDPQALEALARTLPARDAQATHDYLDSLTARQRRDLAGVRDRLAILAESDIGRWLDPALEPDRSFDLLGAARGAAVVYFDLDADSRPLLSQMLGAAIVQDLQSTVAALQARPLPTVVVIDEFSAIAAEQVVRLFGRARSAGVSLVLGTQELADLRLAGRRHLLEQVIGNLTALIAHRQVLPESSAMIASLAGRRGVWRTSRHSDGRTTRTRGHEPVLDADQLLGLDPGWAAVLVLTGSGSARLARIFAATR